MPPFPIELVRIFETAFCAFLTGGFWKLVGYAKSINDSIVELNQKVAVMLAKLDYHEKEIADLKKDVQELKNT